MLEDKIMNRTMDKTNQSITGLEAAYHAVYNRHLVDRIQEVVTSYKCYRVILCDSRRIDATCTELNPGNSVPCFWKLSELAAHYNIEV